MGKGKRKFALLVTFLYIAALLLASCSDRPDSAPEPTLVGGSLKRGAVASGVVQFTAPQEEDVVATIETSHGRVRLVLYPQYAPLAVENFCTLASRGYYNGTPFHRVVKDFVVQGGDPTGTGRGGESIWQVPFATERSSFLRHYSGALCMAGADGAQDTHLSQFYIVATPQSGLGEEALAALSASGVEEAVVEAYRQAGGAPYLDYTDTVFGQVIEGMDVVDTIAASSVESDGVTPKNPVTVLSITVENYIPLYIKGRPAYVPPELHEQPDRVADAPAEEGADAAG